MKTEKPQHWVHHCFHLNPRYSLQRHIAFGLFVLAITIFLFITWPDSRLADVQIGMIKEDITKLLGEPTMILNISTQLKNVPAIHLKEFPGPSGEKSSSHFWRFQRLETPNIHITDLPKVENIAYWYSSFVGGTLIYLDEGVVTKAYIGYLD
jgi:hypothetical protein